MATTAQVTKIRRTSATTTVTPQAGTPQPKTTPALSSKPHTALQKLKATAAQVTSPADVARFLNQMQANSEQSTVGARTAPTTQGGIRIPGLSWVAGTAQLIRHNLGRQPNGYAILRSQASAATSSSSIVAGSMYTGFADTETITWSSSGTFVVVPYAHAGVAQGTTLNAASGTVTVGSAGTYWIAWSGVVSEPNASVTVQIALFINGVQQADGETQYLSTAAGAVSFSTVHTLNASDVVSVRASFSSGVQSPPQTLTLVTSNLSVHGVVGGSGSAPTGIVLTEAALPVGYDSSVALNLVPSATGTGDLWVF